MFDGYLYDCKTKQEALKYALSIYGEEASRLLISVLEDKYKLNINGNTPCSSLEDIVHALFDAAGLSADLIVIRMHAFLRESASKSRQANTN
jgi:hypothetical protein